MPAAPVEPVVPSANAVASVPLPPGLPGQHRAGRAPGVAALAARVVAGDDGCTPVAALAAGHTGAGIADTALATGAAELDRTAIAAVAAMAVGPPTVAIPVALPPAPPVPSLPLAPAASPVPPMPPGVPTPLAPGPPQRCGSVRRPYRAGRRRGRE